MGNLILTLASLFDSGSSNACMASPARIPPYVRGQAISQQELLAHETVIFSSTVLMLLWSQKGIARECYLAIQRDEIQISQITPGNAICLLQSELTAKHNLNFTSLLQPRFSNGNDASSSVPAPATPPTGKRWLEGTREAPSSAWKAGKLLIGALVSINFTIADQRGSRKCELSQQRHSLQSVFCEQSFIEA